MKKILVVRFSSIGDIVLTSPVLSAIKRQIKNVEIHYLTKKQYEGLVLNNPNVDRVFTINGQMSSVISLLKNEKYDYIVDLHRNLRTSRLKLALRRPTSSFPKLNLRKFLLTQFKIDKMPKIHVVDRYFKAVEALGVKNDHRGLDFFVPEHDQVTLSDFNIPDKFMAFAIGAQFATKRLPTNSIIELVNKIETPIVLLGGQSDAKVAEQIEEKCSNTINLTGQLSLNQSASIVKQAQKVISHDTGLMHIAAAFEKPIVSIWGNTVPELGMYPYMPEHQTNFSMHEVDFLNCRPCSKIGHQACPKKHFACMMEQDIEAIAQDVNS